MSLLKGTCFGLVLLSGCLMVTSAIGQVSLGAQLDKQDERSIEARMKQMERRIQMLEKRLGELKIETANTENVDPPLVTDTIPLRAFIPRDNRFGNVSIDFDGIVESIQTHVEPESWATNGGKGHIEAFRSNLSLVVSNSPEVLEKVQQHLQQIEEAAETLSKAGVFLRDLGPPESVLGENRRIVTPPKSLKH